MLDTQSLAAQARACIGSPEQMALISSEHPLPTRRRDSERTAERFELFHFVFSVCSQKVRATLAELKIPYASNELVIFPPVNENYCPDYVSLRLHADAATNQPPAVSFSGRTSVANNGFDALVVPTLVDHVAGKVIADSKNICEYLCTFQATKNPSANLLIPKTLESSIERALTAVDETPHAALLYGGNPAGDKRPAEMQAKMVNVHDSKIAGVRRNRVLAQEQGDRLLKAYDDKLAKERAASTFVSSPDAMTAAVAQTRSIIQDLEMQLAATGGTEQSNWLVGDNITLADLFWGMSLYRLQWLGYAHLWQDSTAPCPQVEAYANRLFARQSIRSSIINWPGHPPSEAVNHLVT